MKDLLKISAITAVGLLTATVIYPLLHELGHMLAAYISGARVLKLSLLKQAYVMCDMSGVGNAGVALTGMGGIFLPYMLSMLLRPKGFLLWYFNTIIRAISLLAIVISSVNVLLFKCGMVIENEDMVQVIKTLNSGAPLFLAILLFMLAVGIIRIVTDKPIAHICEFFGI